MNNITKHVNDNHSNHILQGSKRREKETLMAVKQGSCQNLGPFMRC